MITVPEYTEPIKSHYTQEYPLLVYKVLDHGGKAPWGVGSWPLPNGNKPGGVISVRGPLMACHNGLHGFISISQIVDTGLYGDCLYIAELWGDVHALEDKVVARHGRLVRKLETWNECSLRLFAADCAEQALRYFEEQFPGDLRPRNAVLAARMHALGIVDKRKLDEAWYEARFVAGCSTRFAAESAAWYAAGCVDWVAAKFAAESAARARASAKSAAESAAESAAWYAVESAAGFDAKSAAGYAARAQQSSRLSQYVNGEVDIEAIRKSVMEEVK